MGNLAKGSPFIKKNKFFFVSYLTRAETHNLFAVHKAMGETKLFKGDIKPDIYSINDITLNDKYETLWKTFFESIAIKERTNPKCQQNLLPLWIRTHMNEFTS